MTRYRQPIPDSQLKHRRKHSVRVLVDSIRRNSDDRPIERRLPSEVKAIDDYILKEWEQDNG